MDSVISSQFHQKIFDWWRKHGRVLPWRERGDPSIAASLRSAFTQDDMTLREVTFHSYFAGEKGRDPYRVVVAELMLQQTQVDRVLPKYQLWMAKWPTISDFAKATLAEVLIEWKGLGYNRRAKFLWQLSQTIVHEHEGKWPQSEKELLKLPGIGQYTARAILSFSFGHHLAVVDTNVKRVTQRWFNIHARVQDDKWGEKQWFELADSLLPDQQADPWNQALMDFGALICTAKRPKCELCPVAALCQVNQLAMQQGFANYAEYLASLPVKQKIRKGKDAGKKFEETDRYVRGRIIDILREKQVSDQELLTELAARFHLQNSEQIQIALKLLIKEGMVKKVKGQYGLP